MKNAIPSFAILPTETDRDSLYYNADEEYFFTLIISSQALGMCHATL